MGVFARLAQVSSRGRTPMLRHLAVGLLATTLLILPAAPASRQDPGPGFEEVLAKVETLLEVGRWAQARRMLVEELERREGDASVAARLVEMQEILLRCSFGAAHPPQQPEDVISGELLRYTPARGEIHLRYRPGEPASVADFVETNQGGDSRLHPLIWNGPFTIRLRVDRANAPVRLIACSDAESSFLVFAGEFLAVATGRHSEEGRIVSEPEPMGASAPFLLEVRVGARTLEVLVDGAQRIVCDKPAGMFGHFGLLSFAGIGELECSGKAELSWLQNRVDDAGALARLEYEETYDSQADLPAWLRPYDLSEDPQDDAAEDPDHFAGFADAPRREVARARALLEREDHAAGLAFAESLSEEQVAARLRDWMRALFLLHLGRTSEALEAADRVFALDAADFDTRLAWALLLLDEQQRGAALSLAQSMVAQFPERAEAHEVLAGGLLLDARREEAATVLRRAAEVGVYSHGTQMLERMLVRARRGPAWSRTHEYVSRHYVVRSDISRELCLEAARELDGALRMFEMRLGRIEPHGDERMSVYLFSGNGSYLLYSRDLGTGLPMHTAGMYSPILKQLLIWNLPQREEMLLTVRHEGFHQFLDRRVGRAPIWLNEGLAEYLSHSRLERGRWAHGDPVQPFLDTLRRPGFAWTPLEELLHMGHGEFYERAADNYAEAWHWVHYLDNSSVKNGRRMRAVVDALAGGASERAAVDAAFPAAELAELDHARRAHLAGR